MRELSSMDSTIHAKDNTIIKKNTGSVYAIVTIQVGNIDAFVPHLLVMRHYMYNICVNYVMLFISGSSTT